jgi:hypothetical protein
MMGTMSSLTKVMLFPIVKVLWLKCNSLSKITKLELNPDYPPGLTSHRMSSGLARESRSPWNNAVGIEHLLRSYFGGFFLLYFFIFSSSPKSNL